jgi:hypothetical protein
MKIDAENGETARYNNSASLFNSYMMEYRKFYNKTHIPLSDSEKRAIIPANKNTLGISEAMLENIKREIYAKLSEDLLKLVSHDKLYDIVTNFVYNNIEMLKENRDIESTIEKIVAKTNKINSITLYANKWVGAASPYSQVVTISGVTKNSKIDLNPTVEQLDIFHTKDIAFVVGNNDGLITVYCVGQKPTNDYTIQATITEVAIDG